MAFQIDTFQADAFHLNIPYSPFRIPMSRRGLIGPRVSSAGVIQRYRALSTGDLERFDAYISGPNAGSTSIIFNARIAGGSLLWTGADRPSIAPGASSVVKNDFIIAVTRGQLIEILIDQVPSIGVPTPIDTIFDVVVS